MVKKYPDIHQKSQSSIFLSSHVFLKREADMRFFDNFFFQFHSLKVLYNISVPAKFYL